MSIKSFAYQLSLKSRNQIKRSQCYELFAAAFGFKTYAAIDCVVVMPEHRTQPVNNEMLSSRSRALGLNPDLVITWISEIFAEHSLKPFTFSELALHLEYHPVSDIQPFVEALLPLAPGGNGMAHYCLALLYAGESNETSVGDYWYRQRLSGKELSEIENEYANEYQVIIENIRLAKSHLGAAADLGNVNALIKLALEHDDPRLLDSTAAVLTNTEVCLPWGVIAVADYALSKGRHDEYRRWLTLGCAHGEIEAIDKLASDLAGKIPVAALSLVKYAALLGTDLTRSRNRAINEHGEDYDDDIGGAIYVEEIEGVQILNVTASEDQQAARLASEWFRQYEADGRAKITIA